MPSHERLEQGQGRRRSFQLSGPEKCLLRLSRLADHEPPWLAHELTSLDPDYSFELDLAYGRRPLDLPAALVGAEALRTELSEV